MQFSRVILSAVFASISIASAIPEGGKHVDQAISPVKEVDIKPIPAGKDLAVKFDSLESQEAFEELDDITVAGWGLPQRTGCYWTQCGTGNCKNSYYIYSWRACGWGRIEKTFKMSWCCGN